MPVVVRGLRETTAAFSKAEKQTKALWRDGLRTVAEPVQLDAEGFARTRISRIGPRWYRMRIGVTQKLVYVAPRERGLKTRGDDRRRRPKFGTLLMDRAMDPALERHESEIEGAFEQMLDRVADAFDQGGGKPL